MSIAKNLREKFKVLRSRQLVPDGRSYYVKVPEKTELNMVWHSRQAARQYKKFLKENSLRDLSPEIWEVVFEGGLQIQERKIS